MKHEKAVEKIDSKQDMPSGGFGLTDIGNRNRLIDQHGKDIMYCHDLGYWLIWQENRWVRDGIKELEGRAQDTVCSIHSEILTENSPEKQAETMRWAKQSQNVARISAMIKLAKSSKAIATSSSWLDSDNYVLNLTNGTLNLKTKECYSHKRSDLLTKIAPTEYDLTATCPNWDKFLHQIFGGDEKLISWIQKTMGYALTGDTSEQSIFILWGKGSNGKSTFLNTIKQILSDYTTQIQPETLMMRRNTDGGAPRSDLMALRGARFVTASEGEKGQQLAEALVKQLTGGEVISCRGVYEKSQVEFQPKFKIFFATNYKPQISGMDHGIARRIKMIPFDCTFRGNQIDYDLQSKLMKEASGILLWMIKGCYKWQKEGLGMPESVKKATDDYIADNDQVETFITECCLKRDGCTVGSRELYMEYEKWAANWVDHVLTQKGFSQALTDKGYEKKRSSKGYSLLGLGLLTEG